MFPGFWIPRRCGQAERDEKKKKKKKKKKKNKDKTSNEPFLRLSLATWASSFVHVNRCCWNYVKEQFLPLFIHEQRVCKCVVRPLVPRCVETCMHVYSQTRLRPTAVDTLLYCKLLRPVSDQPNSYRLNSLVQTQRRTIDEQSRYVSST